ncbi:hypothetical protein L195_g036262 [Trifolium pratense]|uniref:Uncharacterized protein n=1 Tax=Trifolium pratense TaxID=57577 RepID=A0A2K3LNZ6_TRIPR|nr:hypothetical protein L195_g036262 [Trifolium pratense]
MPIPDTAIEIALAATIETDKITSAKSISIVPMQSPISNMTTTTSREILIAKENEFMMNIQNDKAKDPVQH